MNWLTYVGIFVLVWTVASIVWIFHALGRKTGKNRWYDYPLCPPAMAIAFVIGRMIRR